SHGIAHIAEYLSGGIPRVHAHGFVSPALRQRGEHEIVDELRVTLIDGDATTAYFTFSSRIRPALHQFRIHGPGGSFVLDVDTEPLVRLPAGRYKSYAHHVLSPLYMAREYLANASRTVRSLLAVELHTKAGMAYLIESFYRSIAAGTPPPIPYRE